MRIDQSLLVTLIGMAVVFIGLVILIFMIKLLSLVMERMDSRRRRKVTPVAVTPKPIQLPPPRAFDTAPAEEDDTALVAAITAALAVMLEQEPSGFVVRRIRRIPLR
ncbi:MAG: OadG family protein [Clostridia bacterium]|nr:OadG family protein [Clostridia bacterium]